MRKLALLLLLAVLPTQAWALNTDELLSTIAMPLAVAAVSNVSGVPATRLADLVTALNQANVPPTQFVEVIRYVPVALVVQNNQQPDLVQVVQTDISRGITGDALVNAIVDQLRTNFNVSPTLTLNEPVTTLVVRDDFIPPVVVERVTTVVPASDTLSLIAMPLAVAAVSDITGVSQNELANLMATLNQANVPPVQVVEVLRFVPVALVADNGQPFVQFVQQQVATGVIGPALVPVVVRRLQTFFPPQTQITVFAPAKTAPPPRPVIVDQFFVQPVVVTRVEELRANPHGGPPGQIKKQLGLQTGAEVVHGQKPGRQFTPTSPTPVVVAPRERGEKEHGRGRHEAAPRPMISSSPPAPRPEEHGHGRGHVQAAPPVVVPQAAPAPAAAPAEKATPPGQEKGQEKGKGGGKGHGKD